MASSALLAEIQKGKGLRKAVTNDRSGPILDGAKGPSVAASSGKPPLASVSGPAASPERPPQLGGLFTGGIPKLRPTGNGAGAVNSSSLAKPPSIPKRGPPSPAIAPPTSLQPSPSPATVSSPPSIKPPSRPPPPPAVAPLGPPIRPPPPPLSAAPPSRPAAPPPALPSRSLPSADTPISSPSRPPVAPPLPPARSLTSQAPSLPARSVPPPPTNGGSMSQPPRRVIPAIGESSNSGYDLPTPSLRATATLPTSSPSRKAPPPPGRASPVAPALPGRTTTPVPPPRPASAAPTTRTGPPPPPPRRTQEEQSAAAMPPRARAVSTGGGPPKSGMLLGVERLESNLGRLGVGSPVRMANGEAHEKRATIIPSASFGSVVFPVDGLPPPRPFSKTTRTYGSGSVRGSRFDLSSL